MSLDMSKEGLEAMSKEAFEEMLKAPFKNDWKKILAYALETESYKNLSVKLADEYVKYKDEIRPEAGDLFKAFKLTPYADVKVVILGQDPYPEAGLAHGLSFSMLTSPKGSLANIFEELKTDLGIAPPSHGDLTAWAQQGVLLLNTVLSLRKRVPKDEEEKNQNLSSSERAKKENWHKHEGWETFTDAVIKAVNEKTGPVIFVLWGGEAQKKEKLINQSVHHVIKSYHPSLRSAWRGFLDLNPSQKSMNFWVIAKSIGKSRKWIHLMTRALNGA